MAQQEITNKIQNFNFTEVSKQEEPYKFIRDYERHTGRCQDIFNHLCLPKSSSVFEIGPGCCYFLYICRDHGCHIDAIDRLDYIETYQGARTALGMEEVVRHQMLKPFDKVKFLQKYDLIICTLPVAFRKPIVWTFQAHMCFLRQVCDHLNEKGRLVLQLCRPDIQYLKKSSSLSLYDCFKAEPGPTWAETGCTPAPLYIMNKNDIQRLKAEL